MQSIGMSRFWRDAKLETPEYLEKVIVFRDVEKGSYRHSDGSPYDPVTVDTFFGRFLLENSFGPVTHWMPLPAAPGAEEEVPE